MLMLLIVVLSLICSGCSSRTGFGTLDKKDNGVAYILYNPYRDVDWDTINHYKANFHTHTLYNKVEKDGTLIWPDGRVLDPHGNEVNEPKLDWDIKDKPRSVYRDSKGITYGSDGQLYADTVIDLYYNAGYKILAITDHDVDYGAATTWPWTKWHRDPSELDMLAVEANEISRPEHIGSFFNDYGDENQHDEVEALKEIYKRTGLAMVFHPGRYTEESTLRDDFAYAFLYLNYSGKPLVGMEVFNTGDRYNEDRILWDRINALVVPDTIVFGYSNDDMHKENQLFRNYQFMLMEELSEEALKEAMLKGAFYFCYEYEGSGRVIPPVPLIESIKLTDGSKVLEIVAKNADSIRWLSENGQLGNDFILDLKEIDLFEDKFVRAELENHYGITFTQPFVLDYSN
jgi:hypothetical protein